MLEKYLQKKMVKALRGAGYFVRKLEAPGFRGFPDLIIIGRGVTLLVEVKTETGVLSKIQGVTIDEINEKGGRAEVWNKFENCLDFIRETKISR